MSDEPDCGCNVDHIGDTTEMVADAETKTVLDSEAKREWAEIDTHMRRLQMAVAFASQHSCTERKVKAIMAGEEVCPTPSTK